MKFRRDSKDPKNTAIPAGVPRPVWRYGSKAKALAAEQASLEVAAPDDSQPTAADDTASGPEAATSVLDPGHSEHVGAAATDPGVGFFTGAPKKVRKKRTPLIDSIQLWWGLRSLSSRLVMVTVMVLILGLILAGSTTTALLRYHLISQIDESLATATQDLSARGVEALIHNQQSSLPSDYYVQVDMPNSRPWGWISDTTAIDSGIPRISPIEDKVWRTGELSNDRNLPYTVRTDHVAKTWRALTTLVYSPDEQTVVGAVTVALPLQSANDTIGRTVAFLLVTGISIIAMGALAARFLVSHSLQPLREIEYVAGVIARGDLTRRIPAGPPDTEVGSLSASLNMMLTQIEQAFAAQAESEDKMRQFISDASHELRTPLATIRGYGELYRLGGVPEENTAEVMGRIESEATRMGRLVEDLLQLARLDEGRPLDLQPVDLVQLARQALRDFAVLSETSRPTAVLPFAAPALLVAPTSADVNGVTGDDPSDDPVSVAPSPAPAATSSPPAPPPASPPWAWQPSNRHTQSPTQAANANAVGSDWQVWALADVDKTTQVMTNLLGNVLRYTPADSPVEIVLGYGVIAGMDMAIFQVRDHGQGVAQGARDKIFERFYRADYSRSRASGGSGLGLAIVAAIVGAHQGHIHVQDTPGGGLTVQVSLPLWPGPLPDSPAS